MSHLIGDPSHLLGNCTALKAYSTFHLGDRSEQKGDSTYLFTHSCFFLAGCTSPLGRYGMAHQAQCPVAKRDRQAQIGRLRLIFDCWLSSFLNTSELERVFLKSFLPLHSIPLCASF